ncbi:TetR family transcriptional regulator [Actinospongicola halichondriae]|uniref:TetR family transcriptional regulator n=1 Tax=Actinospongicola halichondriae TaxID=3236844 RepID=UPI003D50E52B
MPKVATRIDLGALLDRMASPRTSDDVDDRILDAAAGLLAASGLSGLEVDSAASVSGVGRSTIYRRFTDRNQLIAATLAHEMRRFLAALADEAASIDDLGEQVVVAFVAGLRVAQRSGLAALIRHEPLLLRLLTIDSAPLVSAASEHLVALAVLRQPTLDRATATATADVLVRLAISFVLSPGSLLDLDDAGIENAVRHRIGPLVNVT